MMKGYERITLRGQNKPWRYLCALNHANRFLPCICDFQVSSRSPESRLLQERADRDDNKRADNFDIAQSFWALFSAQRQAPYFDLLA